MNIVQYITQALAGTPHARSIYRAALKQGSNVPTSLRQAISGFTPPADAHAETPVFILSAGWRSGSTLLQRIACSNPDHRTLVWGEPYGQCNIVQRLSESLPPIGNHWPPAEFFIDSCDIASLDQQWIANLYPSLDTLWRAHRRFFDELFARPARELGFHGWGIKEVRLGIEHALYLQWLYPGARFLLLYRNPLNAYASYKGFGTLWFDRWPHVPMLTARQFGKHWKRLLGGYQGNQLGDRALLIRYEDLVTGSFDLGKLDAFLGYTVNRDVLKKRIACTTKRDAGWVSRLERLLIKQATLPLSRALGYFD